MKMYFDLGRGPGKGRLLVNYSEVVVSLPEYFVLRLCASWVFLMIGWGRCVASQHNRGVILIPECQFTSWVSPVSDIHDAQEATNDFR